MAWFSAVSLARAYATTAQGYSHTRSPEQDRPVRGDDQGGAALVVLSGVLRPPGPSVTGDFLRGRCVQCSRQQERLRREGSEKRATKGDGCCPSWLSHLLGASRVSFVFRITETYLLKALKTCRRHIEHVPRRGWFSSRIAAVVVSPRRISSSFNTPVWEGFLTSCIVRITMLWNTSVGLNVADTDYLGRPSTVMSSGAIVRPLGDEG